MTELERVATVNGRIYIRRMVVWACSRSMLMPLHGNSAQRQAVIAATLLAATCCLNAGATAHAQETPQDSQQILRALQSAQRAFERTRYRQLPVTFGSSYGPCDERVGRYCYWHDRNDSWRPEPDRDELVRARASLIALLDSGAVLLPGDTWISGQRVRYLIEADSVGAAIAAAQSCLAEPWWCHALEGYAQHSAMDYESAERAFTLALEGMSEVQRCAWTDMSLILPDRLRGDYQDLPCGDREELEQRIWWLADPMYMVPGNERLTEHYKRLVLNKIMSRSATVRRSRWRDDNRELLIRYGYPIGWERERSSNPSLATDDNVIGHHRNGGLRLIPPAEFVADISNLEPGEWDLDPDRPRSVYAPEYCAEMVWLEHDAVLFRRGDSAVVVATFNMAEASREPNMTGGTGDLVEAALVLDANASAMPTLRKRVGPGALSATVSLAPMLMSVEALSRPDSLAARARYWLDIPARLDTGSGGFSISEILLLQASEVLATGLETAVRRALPPGRLERGAGLELFWEMYGVIGGSQQATMSLTVEKEGKSLFRRAGEWLRLVGERRNRIEMRWQEIVDSAEQVPRAIRVQLTPEMRGDYLISVRVELANGARAAASRRVTVR